MSLTEDHLSPRNSRCIWSFLENRGSLGEGPILWTRYGFADVEDDARHKDILPRLEAVGVRDHPGAGTLDDKRQDIRGDEYRGDAGGPDERVLGANRGGDEPAVEDVVERKERGGRADDDDVLRDEKGFAVLVRFRVEHDFFDEESDARCCGRVSTGS